MTSLKGKTIFITGATSGIGEACAKQLAKNGSNLILVGRREERLKDLSSSLKNKYNIRILTLVLDVRDSEKVRTTIANLPKEWQDIDILINNAGLASGLDKAHELKLDDVEVMIDTNLKGLIYVSRAILPGMIERNRGHIVNIGSIAGHEVYAKGSAYCATKHAVDAMTKGMRIDLVDTPIRVSTVDPGLVETEFSIVRFYGDKNRADSVYTGLTPLVGQDIAEIVEFVVSRPAHVQIGEVIVLATNQASAAVVHRESA
jgi:NADP-dependent 3-hydroxy acid dehydrogenase YdfG